MNRSKGAALLLLFGAFAVGGASTYAFTEWRSTPPNRDRCQQRVERDYRKMFYEDNRFTERQRVQWDSLIDYRNKTVNDLYAIPRAKADSVRNDVRDKQRALLTGEQRTSLDERRAAMSKLEDERRKRCEQQQANSKENKSTSSK